MKVGAVTLEFPPSTPQKSPLVGIWELLDESDESRITQLKKAAEQYVINRQENLTRGEVDYLVQINTENKAFAGTDRFIKILFKGILKGEKVQSEFLDFNTEGFFERGSSKNFIKTRIPDLGEIYEIIVRNENYDKKTKGPGWFLSSVKIIPEGKSIMAHTHYYIYQFIYDAWIESNKEVNIHVSI